MVKTVNVPRGNKKVAGDTAVAVFRRKANGHFIDGDWFGESEFMKLVREEVDHATTHIAFVGWEIEEVPRWIRWVLGHPKRFTFLGARPTQTAFRVWDRLQHNLKEE